MKKYLALQMGRSLLKLRIKQAGLSQRDLALLLGVSDSFISMVISGDRTLSLERAVNAADILKCEVKDLNVWHRVALSQLEGRE